MVWRVAAVRVDLVRGVVDVIPENSRMLVALVIGQHRIRRTYYHALLVLAYAVDFSCHRL